MKKVMAKIKRCNTSPELNGLIIDDMEVSPISTKKPRMTIEDLAKIVDEGFRKVNERLDQHDLRFDKQDERMNKHWGIE